MKTLCVKSLLILAVLTAYSHAIIGIGGQWSPNFFAELSGSKDSLIRTSSTLSLNQQSNTGLNGFGLKLWIDAIPFIEVEIATNLQFVKYEVTLELVGAGNADTTIPLEIETGLPFFSKAKPVFGKVTTDLSIKYPFVKFPPLVKIVKLYVGAGLTHVLSAAVLDVEFAKKAVANIHDPARTTDASNAIVDAFAKEGLSNGIGGHVLVGAKIKPPMMPFAVYIDGKLHLGGGLPEEVSSGFTLETGAGLAF